MRSYQQHYAEVAYTRITELQQSNKEIASEFGRLCHRFPALVMMNGLSLAVAFFRSKSEEKACSYYLSYMEEAVGADILSLKPTAGMEYRACTRRVLDASVWFKRYAEAVLKVRQDSESGADVL